MPNCVISVLQGDRDAEELQRLRYEATWIREKLELPADCELLTGQTTLAGTMHVLCSNAHGFKTYIESHKCEDKQGEIARLTVANADLTARTKTLEGERAEFAQLLKDMLDVHDCTTDCWCDEDETMDTCEACQARALIAKLEGPQES